MNCLLYLFVKLGRSFRFTVLLYYYVLASGGNYLMICVGFIFH